MKHIFIYGDTSEGTLRLEGLKWFVIVIRDVVKEENDTYMKRVERYGPWVMDATLFVWNHILLSYLLI